MVPGGRIPLVDLSEQEAEAFDAAAVARQLQSEAFRAAVLPTRARADIVGVPLPPPPPLPGASAL